jgi:hypothetical protein
MNPRRPRFYVLDENHHTVEVGMKEWARSLEVTSNRIVDYTEIASETHVSTVFLGIDHRFFGQGPPILFETMIFGGPLDGSQWRYSSWDDAQAGHKAAVRKAREAIGQKVTEA